jgi:beta-glucanase (GH16 family)
MLMKNSTHIWMTSILVAAAVPITGEAKAQTVTFDPNNPPASGYTMVFDDEFSGYSLDRTKWSPGWSWGSGLNSTYPNDEGLPANISVRNGHANFAVTKGPTPSGGRYGSAVATTYGKFAQTYGYWVASVQMPAKAHGLWPAFWLVPTDFSWPPEIDIMEWLGVQPTIDDMTVHYGTDDTSIGGSFTGPNFSSGFHTLGMLWTRTSITWYVDGVKEFSTNVGVPTKQMYIILNNDTGGWNRNVVDSTTVFPAIFSVRYVRVYSPPLGATSLGSDQH